MKGIDYELVSMLTPTIVRRLSPMRIVVGKVGMTVRQNASIRFRPDQGSGKDSDGGDDGKNDGGSRKAKTSANPTGQRIGQQPAAVRNCEMGGEQGGPVVGVRRAA